MFKRLKNEILHASSASQSHHDLDRLFLALSEKEISGFFPELCFEHKIYGLNDLKQVLSSKKTGLHHFNHIGKLREAFSLAKDKNTNFNQLAKKHGKFDYETELAKEGVPIIPLSDITVQKRLGTGPLSGVALSATLNQNGKTVRVCLRYPRSRHQLEGFLNEAKMLSKLVHPNILKLHGVVVPGPYVNSIALVIEFAPNGNIVESLNLVTVKSFCKLLPQIVTVLHFVDSKGYVHCRLSEFAVYIFSPTLVKIGGFGGCVEKQNFRNKTEELQERFGATMHQLVNPSTRIGSTEGMICWFAVFVERIFFLLEKRRPQEATYKNHKDKKIHFSLYCPEVLMPLLKRCWLNKDRLSTVPSFKEIFEVLQSKDFPPMVEMIANFKAHHPGDISVKKDEQVVLISKSLSSEHHKHSDNFWLGEAEDGRVGLFNGNLATPIINTDIVSDAGDADCEEGTQIPTEIKARGPRAELAYCRALKHGKVVVNRGRIMLVGQERAGKTSLKKSLLGLPFDPGEKSTVGVEVDPSCCSVDVDNVKNWQRMTDSTHTDFADNIARLIADDLKKDENEEQEAKQEFMHEEKESDHTDIILDQQTVNGEDQVDAIDSIILPRKNIALQPDYPVIVSEIQVIQEDTPNQAPKQEAVPEDVTEKVVHYLQGLHLDDSITKSQTIVSIWDFAGQHLYYASHPVFMSPRAVYLLVYNLSKDLTSEAEPCVRQGAFDILLENADKETNLESLLSWLASIHSIRPISDQDEELESSESRKIPEDCPYLRPPVIIVGTNADQPYAEPKKMEIVIKKSLSGKSFQQHLVKPFFTVNNTLSSADDGIQHLQSRIIEVLEKEPYMGEHIPVRWLIFERVIKALVDKKTHYLLLPDLEKIVMEVCFIEESDEIHAMLDYYHDLGVITKHGDTVVLHSQWLIDLFRKLITVRPYDDQNPLYEEYWNDLEASGILHMELVEHVFSELLDSGQSREDLLGMMEHYGLIAGFKKDADIRYFVPAQLRSSPDELLDIQPSPIGPCALYVHFIDGFVPHGLYSLFVSKFIAWCSTSQDGSQHEPNLYRNVSRFIIGKSSDYELIIICRKRFIKVVLRSLQENKSCLYQPAVSVRRFIESTLKRITVECICYCSMRYQLSVLCPSCSESRKPCTQHREVSCSNDDCIHLLEFNDQKVLVCTKSFGKDSRPEVQNLEFWYATPKGDEGVIPTEKLTCLALDIGEKWKIVGRALGLLEADLDEIEIDENQLYERCYAVLRRWTEIAGSSANYEALRSALMHPAAGMCDLAWKYCGPACAGKTVCRVG